MAGTPFTIHVQGTFAAANRQCLVEVIPAANHPFVIRSIEYTEGGTSGTDARTLIESKIGGTATGTGTPGSEASIVKGDPDHGLTLQTTVRGAFPNATLPTATAESEGPFGGRGDPQRGLAKWVGYLRNKESTVFRIYATPAATTTYTLKIIGEE